MIKILIVDDSALVRQSLSAIFDDINDIEVIGVASDPFVAANKIRQALPDVILLDVEMPKMDGVTFLKRIMSQHPIPVIICSTLVGSNTSTQIKALEHGAVDIIQKPTLAVKEFFVEQKLMIADAVRAASNAKIKTLLKTNKEQQGSFRSRGNSLDRSRSMAETTEKVIVIGASTGGTEAIRSVLMAMPIDAPAIAIVQHMPPNFTKSFAERLNEECPMRVKEASNGDTLLRGHVLIAPGDQHMSVKRQGAKYYVTLDDGDLVSRHRPSVDVLFRSAAKYVGKNAVAAILTGMGSDGADGMVQLRNSGACTIGQNEETSVVYGMPREAYERGGVMKQVPLDKVTMTILKATGYA